MELPFVIGLVIVLVILLIFVYHSIEKTIRKHLAGMWKICPLFAKQAQLLDFVFHINEKNKIGYLLASNPSGVILNTPVTIKLKHRKTTRVNSTDVFPDMVEYKIIFEYPDASEEEKKYYENIFPSEQNLAIYPMASRIIMTDSNNAVTGIFTKDPSSIPHNLLPEALSEDGSSKSASGESI